MKKSVVAMVLVTVFMSCAKQEEAPYVAVDPVFEKPSNFPESHYDLASNPITKAGFDLGKKLFYDGKLASDGVVSCAFCHQQKFAFTHHGHPLSHGVDNRSGKRNSQPIQNLAFQKQFSWDGAAFHLDMFPIIPLTNPVEMDETVGNVLKKLAADATYQKMFAEAFKDGRVNADNTFKAMSQFMLMMVSANAKYDKYVRKEENVTLTAEESRGFTVFKSKCSSCHATDLFTDDSFRNNGLPVDPAVDDLGRMTVTLVPEDRYKFKVPSLRNVALTAPYMHDGRFGSLESVLNFYTDGMVTSATIDAQLKRPDGTVGISMTTQEKQDVIAFLKTLTDEEFIKDKRFAE